ncbi:YqgE/AlgH family protein [uncultured Sphingomonas sp.]|uniref:YqgE/AlgH family protein n=1 Tax=uncultured Sphingomonas sp. TaxID=158754 RepID=UPI0025F52F43|nr:YqgE/AlgH family protein [uncultured Sphingomonas sp.]
MSQDDFSSLVGQFLLALPGIGDPRFEQAVIAVCLHKPDGAMGIGLGSVVPRLGLHALLKQLEIGPGQAPDAPIYVGGPVEPQRGFVLHTPDWRGEDTVPIGKTLSLTTTLDVLRAIAAGEGPDHWLVALGYAGWGEGQLDEELLRHGWMTVPVIDELMFETAPGERWSRAYAAAGIDVRLLASTSGHA